MKLQLKYSTMKQKFTFLLAVALSAVVVPVSAQTSAKGKKKTPAQTQVAPVNNIAAQRLGMYKKFALKTDTALLSVAERECITHLIKAAQIADRIFGNKLMATRINFSEVSRIHRSENLLKSITVLGIG